MLFAKRFRRRETPWEVVDTRHVAPIPMWDEDEELEITRMHHTNLTFTFTYELQKVTDLQKAVQFARYKLMQEAVQLQFNILLSEGWHCTLMRKGSRYRVEVAYSGRPAYTLTKVASLPQPPFLGVLEHYHPQLRGHLSPSPP